MHCGSECGAWIEGGGPSGKYKVAKGADLRILDDNIWDYSKDTIPVLGGNLGRTLATVSGGRSSRG